MPADQVAAAATAVCKKKKLLHNLHVANLALIQGCKDEWMPLLHVTMISACVNPEYPVMTWYGMRYLKVGVWTGTWTGTKLSAAMYVVDAVRHMRRITAR